MAAPRIVTRADDLGSFRSATAGIEAVCQKGVARNVSVMAVAPNIEEAAQRLAKLKNICFGLHAVLNCEWGSSAHRFGPLSPAQKVPLLMHEDGLSFAPSPNNAHLKPGVFQQILAELELQYQRLVDLGFTVSYVDTHCGFEWIQEIEDGPRFNTALSKWCQDKKLICASDFNLQRLPSNDGSIEGICAVIKTLPDDQNYLWVNHPCFDDEEMATVCQIGKEPGKEGASRNRQRLNFMHPAILEAIKIRGLMTIRYDEV